MKQKYILGVYDQLIHDIHYNKKTTDSEIISYLKKCSDESHYLHQIKFYKQKEKTVYSHQKGIHNLHPHAPAFIPSDCYKKPEFENLIPFLAQELNIPDKNINFYWTLQHDKPILILKETCLLEDVDPAQRFFLYCFQMVQNENHKIKSSLNKTFFSLQSEEKIELFVHRKQYALEKFSKTLIDQIKPDDPHTIYSFSSHYDKIDCLKIIHIHLEKLLIFIEKEYRNYLNVNLQVPYKTVLTKKLELVAPLQFVKLRLLESPIDKRLMQLAYGPLLKISTITFQEKITYNEFHYCCAFITELHKQFQQHKEALTESILKGWLFDLNLNSPEFLNYKTNEISKSLALLESELEKIDALYQILKGFNQRQRPDFIPFHTNSPSIKEQIVDWIEEEIAYLSKKKSLAVPTFLQPVHHMPPIKIQTSLSVAQLSYFIRLLMKAQIIIHKNHSEVFRFIAEHFVTPSTTQISADSVKSKFYNVEQGTMRTIRSYIIELMNLTK